MTIQECQENHKKLWMWIADETRNRKKLVDKHEYFEAHPDLYIPVSSCYLCEYAGKLPFYRCKCVNCPLYGTEEECNQPGSCYRQLQSLRNRLIRNKGLCMEDILKAVDLAEKIANLPIEDMLKAVDLE